MTKCILAVIVLFCFLPEATGKVKPVEETFLTADGVRLKGRFYKCPKPAPGNPVVILMYEPGAGHSMEKPGDWNTLLEKLEGAGFHVFQFDWRGHGKSTDIVDTEGDGSGYTGFWTNGYTGPWNKKLISGARKRPVKNDLFVKTDKPMALTVIFALLTSLILALFLMPVLASVFLRSVSETEPFLVRWAKALYRPLLRNAVDHPASVMIGAVAAFAFSVFVASTMGAVFIPKLDEGSIAIQATRLPSVSLESSVAMTGQLERCLLRMPEVESVVSKSGRPEIANDPMTINLTDVIVTLKPKHLWRFARKEELVEEMEETLKREVPGQIFAFSQPIELRVAELIAGVKTDGLLDGIRRRGSKAARHGRDRRTSHVDPADTVRDSRHIPLVRFCQRGSRAN